MRSAYVENWIHNLGVIKDAKSFLKADWISKDQYEKIGETYASPLYHPNFLIRILLFVATLLGISGVTGLFALFVAQGDEVFISIACMAYGIASFFVVDKLFIKDKKHYKSGVNEAIIYHSCGFTIGGFAGLTDFSTTPFLLFSLVVLTFAAIRYLDLICTITSFGFLGFTLFYHFYEWGGILQQIIPFAFIICFSIAYFLSRKYRRRTELNLWNDNLLIVEALSLAVVYLAGNYLVVRELSVNLMGLALEGNEDIPFAFIFYLLTIAIPILYLWFGVKNKDLVLLRVSLIVLAFSVFTFKYYYGFNRPEITLTIAGMALLGISLSLFNYLKVMRSGYTREKLLSEKWSSMNAEAFIISQTLGGNQVKVSEHFEGQGGEFGGGGSSGSF